MQLGRIFLHAFVRRVAIVAALALLAWVGLGEARASFGHLTMAEAYNHAVQTQAAWNSTLATGAACEKTSGWVTQYNRITHVSMAPPAKSYFLNERLCVKPSTGQTGNAASTSHDYPVAENCPPGQQPDLTTGQCIDPGARCRAKNDAISNPATMVGAFGNCVDGCLIGERPNENAGKVDVNSTTIHFGPIGYTGETCEGNAPPPPFNPGQSCTAAGGGMTFCVKPGGQHCYSASTGNQICWQPGETGNKSDGPITQTRGPGTTAPTPPAPPPGESTTPGPGGPATTNTTTPNGTVINTTTVNHTNTNGTNGTGTPSGEPGDGSSPSGDGDGDDDDETASGGETCATPPTCSESASIGCGILHQQWRMRCAGPDVTGGEDCTSPPSACTGAQCFLVHSLWRMRCADPADAVVISSAEIADQLDGANGGLGNDPAEAAEFAGLDADDVRGEETITPEAMFGDLQNILPSGQCPVVPNLSVKGVNLPFNFGPLCDLFINIGQLVLALAYFKGAQIYMGGR